MSGEFDGFSGTGPKLNVHPEQEAKLKVDVFGGIADEMGLVFISGVGTSGFVVAGTMVVTAAELILFLGGDWASSGIQSTGLSNFRPPVGPLGGDRNEPTLPLSFQT